LSYTPEGDAAVLFALLTYAQQSMSPRTKTEPLRTACAMVLRTGLALGLMHAVPAVAAPAVSAVDEGKYIAIAADCASCHTKAGGALFAGGDALKTVFGNLYAPNITPDVQTGIGAWSAADFERALRHGLRRDGARLYPAMPYDHYTKLSDADVSALWAYMRSVPAVANKVPANTMAFPTNVREGLAVWQAAFFKPGRFVPVPGKDETWNRGAYLVDALAHCGACHTPRNVAQASEDTRRLTGASIEGWYAPDISGGALSPLASRDIADLEHFLKTGEQGNTKTFGPMQEVVHDSLRHLSDADLHAMAVYLKDQPTARPDRPVQPRVTPAQLSAGKAVYDEHCVSCHRSDGRGEQAAVPSLAGNPAVTAREPYNVMMAVLTGFDAQGTWGPMASFAKALGDQQIADVTNYVRSAWGNRAQRDATPSAVETLRAAADVPAGGERTTLVCPILSAELMRPALAEGAAALQRAAVDSGAMTRAVRTYVGRRPHASNAEVVEALSAAYCRTLLPSARAAQGASRMSMGVSVAVAAFSQDVAEVLVQTPPLAIGSRARPSPPARAASAP
jgi:mono/diheme cytochrome c family protein